MSVKHYNAWIKEVPFLTKTPTTEDHLDPLHERSVGTKFLDVRNPSDG